MLGFNRSHCNPPLGDKEVAVVVANIARRETDRRTKNRAKAGVNG